MLKMEKKGSVELVSCINELESQLHQQILSALNGFSPAIQQLTVEIFPAVTKSMAMYLKGLADKKAHGGRKKCQFRKETKDVEKTKDNEETKHVEETQDNEETKDVDETKGFTSRAGLPPTKDTFLELMQGSVFHKILKGERRHNNLLVVRDIMELYDIDKEAFLIGDRWCVLCEHEVAFLLGIKAEGEDVEIKPESPPEMKSKMKQAEGDLPQYLIELAPSLKLLTKKTFLSKGTLETILEKTVLTEENRDSVKNLIYFFLLNYFIFPTSNLYGRHKFFLYDMKVMEETNWAKVIHKCVISDIRAFKNPTKKIGTLSFFPPLLEAWFYYRTNSFEKSIQDNPDDAPMTLCFSMSETSSSSPSITKSSTCSHCKDKEERLSKESPTTAKTKKKFSLSSGPLAMDVHQNIAIQILKFCLDHVKQTSEEEELGLGASEDELLHSMKDDWLKDQILKEALPERNWPWALVKALATTTQEKPTSEEVNRLEQVGTKRKAAAKKQVTGDEEKVTVPEPTLQLGPKKKAAANKEEVVVVDGESTSEEEQLDIKKVRSKLQRQDHDVSNVVPKRLRSGKCTGLVESTATELSILLGEDLITVQESMRATDYFKEDHGRRYLWLKMGRSNQIKCVKGIRPSRS